MTQHVVTLFVPGPLFTINAERSMHRFTRAEHVKTFRLSAKLLTYNRLNKGEFVKFTDPVFVDFYPRQGKRGALADTANHLPTAKACLDGVVDAGLIPDDSPEHVLWQRFWPPVKDGATGMMLMIHTAAANL